MNIQNAVLDKHIPIDEKAGAKVSGFFMPLTFCGSDIHREQPE